MTEFQRTTQAVDDIERLLQQLPAGGGGEAQRLSQLVGETRPVVEKLRKKAVETDLFGEKMKAKVHALVDRWGPIDSSAADALRQRGLEVVVVQAAAAAPPAPRPEPIRFLARAAPPGGAPPASAASVASATSSSAAARPSSGGGTAVGGASAASADDRRRLAAQAAEARLHGGPSCSSKPVAAAGDAGPAPMEVDSAPVVAAGPPVAAMADLLRLVHGVFVGHGFAPEGGAATAAAAAPLRVRYAHATGRAPPILATYVPVQRHLVIYAALEGAGATSRATVQLGMAAASVQAKVDYLVVYPLLYSQCAAALSSIPPEVFFGLVTGLALPGMAALGAASKSCARAVFEDDVLWWGILTALPQSDRLCAEIAAATGSQHQGQQLAAGRCRQLVKAEVQRCRADAEERRRRREEEWRMREEMQRRMMQQQRPSRGAMGLGGRGIIGGSHDLFPGGGMPMPFGGGGGPFGGFGGRGGGGPRFF